MQRIQVCRILQANLVGTSPERLAESQVHRIVQDPVGARPTGLYRTNPVTSGSKTRNILREHLRHESKCSPPTHALALLRPPAIVYARAAGCIYIAAHLLRWQRRRCRCWVSTSEKPTFHLWSVKEKSFRACFWCVNVIVPCPSKIRSS